MDYKIILLLVIIHILGSVYFYRILRDNRREENESNEDDYDWSDVILVLLGCNFWMVFVPMIFLINCLTSKPPKYL